ncbi:MAG: sensor histidine kinase [Phycisphaerales bacterium JB060]
MTHTEDSGNALRERVKELRCLYEVAAAFVELREDRGACLERVVAALPAACRRPERTAAGLRLDGAWSATPHFESAEDAESGVRVPLVVAGVNRGALVLHEVGTDATGFLDEERSMLDAVARQVGLFIERVEADQRRAATEAQLRHADRLASIGQLAAGVAHELAEPLASIMGFAQLAQKAPGLPGQAHADMERIVRAAMHGREVIGKLLAFAHPSTGAVGALNMSAVVEEALFLLEAGCDRPGVRFVRELAADLPPVRADAGQVRQVVTNLVMNAVHAVGGLAGGGTITVETRMNEDAVELVVRDTGPGMDEATARRVFDPFFTTKDVGVGTGLGLSVVQGIVAAHGGGVMLETSPGQGACFTVRLPVTP